MTKNKKKKEREAALKMKKETGARKKENPKGSLIFGMLSHDRCGAIQCTPKDTFGIGYVVGPVNFFYIAD